MNYYELLEISSSASVEVIRNAYKTLAKKYHPDTYKGDTSFAEEKMKLLNEAVSVLEDEVKRSEYNKINGINSRPGSGRGGMINFDENGEPIFYSYDSDPEDSGKGVNQNGASSYMDIIDDFINTSFGDENSKNKPNKRDNEIIPDEIIADIAADISKLNASKFGGDDYENPDGAESSDSDSSDFKIKSKPKSSAKNPSSAKKNRIYWSVIAFLGAAIILMFILIMQKVNLDNIGELFSGNPEPDDGIAADSNIDDIRGENGDAENFEDEPSAIGSPEQTTAPLNSADPEPEPEPSIPEPATNTPTSPNNNNNNNNAVTTNPPSTTARPAATRPNPPTQPATPPPQPTPPSTEPTEEPLNPAETEPETEPTDADPPEDIPEAPTDNGGDGNEGENENQPDGGGDGEEETSQSDDGDPVNFNPVDEE